jgi:Na+-translocating ferredoxin:NAD+ oxidoreductase RnfA subunit
VDFVLDLLQGAGIAAGIGIRPFLPFALTAALAMGDVGLDFDGTDFSFLEEWWFVIAIAVVVIGLELVDHARDIAPVVWALLVVAVGLGALVGAGSLADNDHPIVPGIVAGALTATLGFYAARSLFGRVRRRLDREAQSALPVYGAGAALVAAGLSILFPPLAILVIAALAWLLLGGRRRADEKYAGLRILR